MWAARPHLASIFEKLLDQKTFGCLRQYSWKTTQIRFGKAGAHPQLALGIAIAPETLSLITTFWFWRQLRFFRFSLRFSLQFLIQFLFASQMWAARPHLGSIFEKLLHRKTFYLPAARSCKNYGVLYDFHTVFIDTHQQECYNIDVHRKNEFRWTVKQNSNF